MQKKRAQTKIGADGFQLDFFYEKIYLKTKVMKEYVEIYASTYMQPVSNVGFGLN